MNILNYIVLRYIINMSNSCSPLALSLGKLFGIDNKSSDEQEKKQDTAIANIKKLVEENKDAIEKINDEGKDAPKDIVVWYFAPGAITNFQDKNEKGQASINTYSTYRQLYNAKDGAIISNSGINFSETYIENDSLPNATQGQENYSTFTINLGYKSVSGSAYGLADQEGYWPADAIVLATIPNKGVFAGSAKNEDQLPYNHVRIKTYPDKWRSVHFSANKIEKNAPLPTNQPVLGSFLNDLENLIIDT
jgi:hypothetical protein